MWLIRNDHQRIAETNYWDTPAAQHGYCYLSWNAGAARLLVPERLSNALLPEVQAATTCVVISRGKWIEVGGRDALELLFEDGSDNPYYLLLAAEQCDRMIPDSDQGGGFIVAIWTQSGHVAEWPGKYRVVESIPCADAWVDH